MAVKLRLPRKRFLALKGSDIQLAVGVLAAAVASPTSAAFAI